MDEIKEYKNRIKKAIEKCKILMWDNNRDIDDV